MSGENQTEVLSLIARVTTGFWPPRQLHLRYLYFVISALYWYDYFLTFGSEASHHGNPFGRILNNTIFKNICSSLITLQLAMEVAILMCSAAFSALRVHALSASNLRMSICTFIFNAVNPSLCIYVFFRHKPRFEGIPLNIQGCGVTLYYHSIQSMVAGRIMAVLADGIVLLISWIRLQDLKTSRHLIQELRSTSLLGVILKDSSIYFLVLLCTDIVCAVFCFLSLRNVWYVIQLVEVLSNWMTISGQLLFWFLVLSSIYARHHRLVTHLSLNLSHL
ncbi:hypothetical protein WOLCODRAFT_143847 [Wolfiporia cocos MD-104 SS10]|uniref:Uncharacterized protein n=1 Tax=Wolfiporia cocos (strain MD-104) TaxID=742152 RepID=A0A2H3JT50_WOLCO|nr:hypothetical protein WOLCODRAFT_143847 [Wolfiporia cocos MD-104 SS10]